MAISLTTQKPAVVREQFAKSPSNVMVRPMKWGATLVVISCQWGQWGPNWGKPGPEAIDRSLVEHCFLFPLCKNSCTNTCSSEGLGLQNLPARKWWPPTSRTSQIRSGEQHGWISSAQSTDSTKYFNINCRTHETKNCSGPLKSCTPK